MPENRKHPKGESSGFQLKQSAEPIPDAERDGDEAEHHAEELPHSYGVDTIFLIAQDPHWLFTYWDIDIAKHPGGTTFLRCCTADGAVEQEIEVPFETRNWYIPVQRAGANYYVTIGYHRGGSWQEIARSAVVPTPAEEVSSENSFDFATVPLHLSFQRLADNLHSVLKSGENLMQVVSRMQRSGDFSAFGGVIPPLVTPEYNEMLSTLLGADLATSLTARVMLSSELHSRVQARLEDLLSSGGASETIALLESLSSFSGASPFVSQANALQSTSGISSWSPVEMASWAAGWITSWTQADTSNEVAPGASSSWGGQFSGSTLDVHGSSGGISSGSVVALASWLSAATSSGGSGESSTASLPALTNWLSDVQSSWAQAATSSWTPTGEASSWLSGVESSGWSSSGESSSPGFSPEREFFMHVNAEVIFYGGTHPKAKLTIDNKPVALHPDGTFRYHCVFPDADYGIPIVATSPDGKESRKATLRFHRDTGKVGIVTDTPQPPLDEPVGRLT